MKKFYKQAEAGTAPGGFVIRLDGKLLKTPMLHNLILPSQKLAEGIAAEWNAQGADLVPSSMPLTQLANTMADKAAGSDRIAMNEEVIRYGSSDLVCYFAAHPADLLKRQEECWLPLLTWMKEDQGIVFETVKGIRYINQPDEAMKKIRGIICGLNAAEFTVVQSVAAITGSVVIALALLNGKIDSGSAYNAACVDEIYQLEKWGEDTLARQRLDKIKQELAVIERFKSALL